MSHVSNSLLQNPTSPVRNLPIPDRPFRFLSSSSHPSSSRIQSKISLSLPFEPRACPFQPRACSNPVGGISHSSPKIGYSRNGGNGESSSGCGHGGSGGTGGGNNDKNSGGDESNDHSDFWVLGLLINEWRTRVAADPQFPFKVLMGELVGVTSCVLGDMGSRPNFGLNELDFVFSTLVVGSTLNFVLMYLLDPTASGSALPAIFASCPRSHMFERGAYSLANRLGTLVYKGALFAAVGLAAGLVGTALSNGLITMRKKMYPNFVNPNDPPRTLLNALTWAIHMGVSSNLRYQTLNGVEFVLARGLPPAGFKASVILLRCLNNVLGGVSFVVLARLTGAQKVEAKVAPSKELSGFIFSLCYVQGRSGGIANSSKVDFSFHMMCTRVFVGVTDLLEFIYKIYE